MPQLFTPEIIENTVESYLPFALFRFYIWDIDNCKNPSSAPPQDEIEIIDPVLQDVL